MSPCIRGVALMQGTAKKMKAQDRQLQWYAFDRLGETWRDRLRRPLGSAILPLGTSRKDVGSAGGHRGAHL